MLTTLSNQDSAPDGERANAAHQTDAPQSSAQTVPQPVGQGLLWAILLFIIALVPRLHQLTYHSLWLDEAISVGWARLPAEMIISSGLELAQDRHPPLYYLALHYWTHLFGEGEVSVRLLSVIIGALAAPLSYMLVRELYGHRAGAVAAVLVAFNPFLVWYSQEVRMFALAVTLLLAASWSLVGALQRFGGWHRWALYVLLATASFYTYLFSALVLAAHASYVALCWLRWRPVRQKTWPAIAAFVALATACAPLALQAWHVGAGEAARGEPFGNLGAQFHNILRAFLIWKAPWQEPSVDALVALLGLMALWGALVGLFREKNRRGPSFVAIYLLVPWLLANLLLFLDRTVFDEARYMIFLAPAFCLAIARPIGSRETRVRTLATLNAILALLVFVLALPNLWTPESRREEWRAAARYLETYAAPDEVILLHADYVHKPFLYYYRGAAPVVYPFTGAIESEAQITPVLDELAEHRAVWLVRSHWEIPDPQGLIEQWFGKRFPLITEQYPPGVTIKGYATSYRYDILPDTTTPLEATFDGVLQLVGCRIVGKQFSARDNLYHPPSGWVHVTLFWKPLRTPNVAYAPFVRLTDELGQVWGDSLGRPTSALRLIPPDAWRPGMSIRDDYDINLNPITPPGAYSVVVSLKRPDGAVVTALEHGQTVERAVCGAVEIVSAGWDTWEGPR